MKRDRAYQYVARQHDCQRCPIKAERLPPGQKRRYVALSIFHPLLSRAGQRLSLFSINVTVNCSA